MTDHRLAALLAAHADIIARAPSPKRYAAWAKAAAAAAARAPRLAAAARRRLWAARRAPPALRRAARRRLRAARRRLRAARRARRRHLARLGDHSPHARREALELLSEEIARLRMV